MFLYYLTVVLVLGLAKNFYNHRRAPPGTRYPPGPTGLPLIGRVWDIPRQHTYKRFKKWSDHYGPIFSINLFGINHIWLSSDKMANDLMVKRATKHSDRPSINQLANSKNDPEYLPLLGHNEVWKRQRKIVTQFMANSSKTKFHQVPYLELGKFLTEIMAKPANYETIMEDYTSRTISRLAFGVPDYYYDIKMHSLGLLKAISPAAYITNIIPQLKALPFWINPWKWVEKHRHAEERIFFMNMFWNVKERMANGTARSSFMREVVEKQPKTKIPDLEASYVVGIIGLAGVLTTSSALMNYVLAMTLYPEWQEKLQEEVDRVCGERMPVLEDSPGMPILRSIIMELLRWRPITPTSIPHETTEDDIYEGYFIPKGTYIHPNQWAITRDTSVYPDPEVFNPDRWINPAFPTYKEPLTKFPCIQNFTTFGYGRRLCMGMDLVEQQFFVAMGAMAWAFNIAKKRDEFGREIHVEQHDFTSYLISRPKNFAFDLTPRSEKKVVQIQEFATRARMELDLPYEKTVV